MLELMVLTIGFIAALITIWSYPPIRKAIVQLASRFIYRMDRDRTAYINLDIPSLTEKEIEALREIKLSSLAMLLEDQLSTGAWSKTYFWRKRQSNNSVPPIGTLTGTLLVLKSLMQDPLINIPNLNRLESSLASIQLPDGSFFKRKRIMSIAPEIEKENLRHTAAGFCLRSMLSKIDKKDRGTISGILGLMEDFSSWDYFDLSNVLRMLVTAYPIYNQKDARLAKKLRDLYNKLLAYLTGCINDDDSILSLWSPKQSIQSAGDAKVQWAAIWGIVESYHLGLNLGINADQDYKILLAIESFIESTLDFRRSNTQLLADKYRGNWSLPHGESVFATSTAVIALSIIIAIYQYIKRFEQGCDQANHMRSILINKLVDKGCSLATVCAFTTERPEDLEGYLAWTSLLKMCDILGCKIEPEDIEATLKLLTDSPTLDIQLSMDCCHSIRDATKGLSAMYDNLDIKTNNSGHFHVNEESPQ